MKTKEELNALKEEDVETLNEKLVELTEEELSQVTGGNDIGNCHHMDAFAYRNGYFHIGGSTHDCGNHCVHWLGGDGGCDLD